MDFVAVERLKRQMSLLVLHAFRHYAQVESMGEFDGAGDDGRGPRIRARTVILASPLLALARSGSASRELNADRRPWIEATRRTGCSGAFPHVSR